MVNPFRSKGFPFDEQNRLALDRVKSISALSAHAAVKGLTFVQLQCLMQLRFSALL